MILEVKEVRKIFKRLSDLEDKLFQVMEEFAQVKKFDV
jgi:tetrahydromethanopterin S-methyltransferase subunit G